MRGQVARALEHRPGGLAQVHAHLGGDDVRQRGLAQAGRAEQQHVVERLAALARGGDEDLELLADASPVRRSRRAASDAARARPPPRAGETGAPVGRSGGRARSWLCQQLQRLLDAVGHAGAGGQLAGGRRPPRARSSRARAARAARRCRGVGTGACPAPATSGPSLPLSSSSSRSAVFLPMPGTRVQAAGLLQRDGLRQVGHRHAGQHRQRDARADAGDPDQLAEGLALAGASGSRTAGGRPRARPGG